MTKPEPITEPCCGPRCERPARVRGMCWGHYDQWKRLGKLGVLVRRQVSPRAKVTPLYGPPCQCGCGRRTRTGNRRGFTYYCQAKGYHLTKGRKTA